MNLPDEEQLRFIILRTAQLQHRFGKELGRRPLVLPSGKFFPDKFSQNEASVLTLLRRMQEHAGMLDVPMAVALVGGSVPKATGCGTGSCGTGACAAPESDVPSAATTNAQPQSKPHKAGSNGKCGGKCGGKGGCEGCDGSCHHDHDHDQSAAESALDVASLAEQSASCGTGCGTGCGVPTDTAAELPRLVDLGESWKVQVPASELTHPIALTTNLARVLGVVFLAETSSKNAPIEAPLEVTSEIASCLLGFGSLLLAGSYVYSKGCGGPRIGRITALGPFDLAIPTVLFAKRHGYDLRPLMRTLEPTQKDAMAHVLDWLDERPTLVERYLQNPERLAAGDIPLAPTPVGLFARWFGRKPTSKVPADPESSLAELEQMLVSSAQPVAKRPARKRDPRADELRSLVDEALASTLGPSE